MTGATDETKTNHQEEAVGLKRKHQDESGTENVQTEDLTTVTHMGAVGPPKPNMGMEANLQQSPSVVETATHSIEDILAAARSIEQANTPPTRGVTPSKRRRK
jgi:hypothetical protein